jgi:hypothetical protein
VLVKGVSAISMAPTYRQLYRLAQIRKDA